MVFLFLPPMKHLTLQGKVVLVTGGSSGIGRACCEIYGKAGAKVAFTGRNRERMEETTVALTQAGIENLPIHANAASEEDCRKMVEETVQRWNRLDILINNAGITMRALFEELELDVFRQVMDINFYGTVYATKYALPHILSAGGSVISVSSINGYRGTPARTAYTASKYAMNGFMEALRTEVMHRGVHVLVVAPGFTASNIRNAALTASGAVQGESPRDESKMMTSEEVAAAMLKATLKRKRDLVLTSKGKLAVFLNKWMPGRMDKIVYNVMAKEKDSPFK